MKKLFCITIFLAQSLVTFSQNSKKSTALDEIQKKIDDLNTRISSLASKKARSSITNPNSPISKKTGYRNIEEKESDKKFNTYELLEKINSIKAKAVPIFENIETQNQEKNILSTTSEENFTIIEPDNNITKDTNSENSSENKTDSKIIFSELDNSKDTQNEQEKNRNKTYGKIFVLDDSISVNNLSLYLGFSMPNKSKFRKYGIQFEEGNNYTIEYHKKLGSYFIGSTIGAKYYMNKKITGISIDDTIKGNSSDYIHLVETGQIRASGENKLYSFSLIAGWQPKLTDRIFIKNKISLGLAHSERELKIEEHTLTQSDTLMYYSLLSGLGIRWTNHFYSLFYYQFDGQSEVSRFDDQTFHEIGISLGVEY